MFKPCQDKDILVDNQILDNLFDGDINGVAIIDGDYTVKYASDNFRLLFGNYNEKKCYEYLKSSNHICGDCINLKDGNKFSKKWIYKSQNCNNAIEIHKIEMNFITNNNQKIILLKNLSNSKLIHDLIARLHHLESNNTNFACILHDYNNIITKLYFTKILANEETNISEIKKYLARIEEALKLCINISEYNLEDNNLNKRSYKKINIVKVITHATEFALENSNIVVKYDFNDETYEIPGNYAHLFSAFLNIMINSKEAMNDCGNLLISLKPYLESDNVQLQPSNMYLKITFKDSGCGIPEENLNELFEKSFTTKLNGKGLGLLSCKKIIDNHNGTIEINSEVGIGTEVKIILPIN